jgi:hypothetical protein
MQEIWNHVLKTKKRSTMVTLLTIFVLLSAFISCTQNTHRETRTSKSDVKRHSESISAKYLTKNNKVLLILGQDLTSVRDYVNCGYFPNPGGVATYLSFYNLVDSAFPAYGALGQDIKGNPVAFNVDWGAGPLNAHSAAFGYPNSILVIGLSIAEGNDQALWASGELLNIGVGTHDDKIRRLAKFCKDIDIPIYLRIGYEFDGVWNKGYENKTNFVRAFQHIVEVMRKNGVSNVAYVWHACTSPIDDIIEGYHENIEAWYPGDDYVDWMGLSWFLPPDEMPQKFATQRQLANELASFARKKSKPVMIAESAPQRYDLEQLTKSNFDLSWDGAPGTRKVNKTATEIWNEWFVPFFNYIHSNSDVIRAVAYINADWDSQMKWSSPYNEGYWGDTRVQMNITIRNNWLKEINNTSFWLHGSSNIRDQLDN